MITPSSAHCWKLCPLDRSQKRTVRSRPPVAMIPSHPWTSAARPLTGKECPESVRKHGTASSAIISATSENTHNKWKTTIICKATKTSEETFWTCTRFDTAAMFFPSNVHMCMNVLKKRTFLRSTTKRTYRNLFVYTSGIRTLAC